MPRAVALPDQRTDVRHVRPVAIPDRVHAVREPPDPPVMRLHLRRAAPGCVVFVSDVHRRTPGHDRLRLRQQPALVVAIARLAPIARASPHRAAEHVVGHVRRDLSVLAVIDALDQFARRVVPVALPTAVEAGLFDQPVAAVIAERSRLPVRIGQLRQTADRVVPELLRPARRIDDLRSLPVCVPVHARHALERIRMRDRATRFVVFDLPPAHAGRLRRRHASRHAAAVVAHLTERVGGLGQLAERIVVIGRRVSGAIGARHELTRVVPLHLRHVPQCIRARDGQAVFVGVTRHVAERIGFARQVTVRVVAALPDLPCRVGNLFREVVLAVADARDVAGRVDDRRRIAARIVHDPRRATECIRVAGHAPRLVEMRLLDTAVGMHDLLDRPQAVVVIFGRMPQAVRHPRRAQRRQVIETHLACDDSLPVGAFGIGVGPQAVRIRRAVAPLRYVRRAGRRAVGRQQMVVVAVAPRQVLAIGGLD
ncbi:hypothetical protein FEP70_05635 [Burkholderia multivorans]|nr:hypothetical protein [Burkholderia multivorans]MDR8915032.1 hypothetical protein [Burkholderia multivorans]MDR8951278.1 hypothetical protein [Burkholderia multivorans]MDR8987685.1 hypothetical protein [Burkholderia multivorans]MDR9048450.1 hypothetical protein [Burkholderia multivorans]